MLLKGHNPRLELGMHLGQLRSRNYRMERESRLAYNKNGKRVDSSSYQVRKGPSNYVCCAAGLLFLIVSRLSIKKGKFHLYLLVEYLVSDL